MVTVNLSMLEELKKGRWPIDTILGHQGTICRTTRLLVAWEDNAWDHTDDVINVEMNKLMHKYKDNLHRVDSDGMDSTVAKWKPSCIFLQDMHHDANQCKMKEYCDKTGLSFPLLHSFMT